MGGCHCFLVGEQQPNIGRCIRSGFFIVNRGVVDTWITALLGGLIR